MGLAIYLASDFHHREKLKELGKELRNKGFRVVSNWIYLTSRPDRNSKEWEEFAKNIAATNMMDLLRADILVIDAKGISDTNNGGSSFEFGFALARGNDVYIIGDMKNTFSWLPQVIKVKDTEELLKQITYSSDGEIDHRQKLIM